MSANSDNNSAAWRGNNPDFHGMHSPPEMPDENAGLPELNRNRNNRFVTWMGFAVIAMLGVALIFQSFDKTPKKRETDKKEVANNLPRLVVPDLPPPPVTEAPPTPAANTAKSPDNDWLARKMNGTVMLPGSGNSGSSSANGSGNRQIAQQQRPSSADLANARLAYLQNLSRQPGASGNTQSAANETALGASLRATEVVTGKARILPNRNFVLAKGSSLDCVLETALDSSVPGMATCRLTRDIYSDNGKVLLLDRGSQLVGEYQGGMRNGQKRMFLLWTRVKTPSGVVVNLDNPNTDSLGRGGLGGYVDNHFWERFGAAILTSLVSDGVQIIVQNQDKNGGNRIYLNQTASAGVELVKEMLSQNANIPPTLIVNQGARVSVLVARDLDFSDVYTLKVR